MDCIKRIWYLSPMRAAKVQASLRIRAVSPEPSLLVSPEPSLLAHTSSESIGTFRQKARSLAPLNGWACAVKICHDGMLKDTNSLDGAQISVPLVETPRRVCLERNWELMLNKELTKKNPKQCVLSFCENNPYGCVLWESVPFHWLFWVLSLHSGWETHPFLSKLPFSNPKWWQHCALPSSEKSTLPQCFQTLIPSLLVSTHPVLRPQRKT